MQSLNFDPAMNKLEQIMAAIDRFVWQRAARARASYLSESTDLPDLEQRMRQLAFQRSPFPYY
jgi:hypothetical protein